MERVCSPRRSSHHIPTGLARRVTWRCWFGLARLPRPSSSASSRVTCIEPKYIEQVTGRRCYNSGVSVGCPVDYLVQFRFLLSLGIKPELLIVGVDEWALGDHGENDHYDLQLMTYPPLFRQVPLFDKLWIAWRALKTITLKSTRNSLENLMGKTPVPRMESEDTATGYHADGLDDRFSRGYVGPDHAELLAAGIDEKVAHWSAVVDDHWKVERMRPQPRQTRYFRELMTLAKQNGVQVYVVLLPLHPEYERGVFTPRLYEIRVELSMLLRDTCREFGAVYRDCSSLESFGGNAEDFVDGVHLTAPNARRMIDLLLRPASNQATTPEARPSSPTKTAIAVTRRS